MLFDALLKVLFSWQSLANTYCLHEVFVNFSVLFALGSVPLELVKLTYLIHLDLCGNKLKGT